MLLALFQFYVYSSSELSFQSCILHQFNNDLKNWKQREKNTLPYKNIEDKQTEESITVCFSDNSYDKCNPK